MAKYDVIKFNIDRARQIIVEEYEKYMKQAITESIDEIKGEFSRFSFYGTNKDGVSSVDIFFRFEDIRAWVMFFGSGQDIVQDNPYLDEYMRSDLWATNRPNDGTVVGRKDESPFGQYNYKTGIYRFPIRSSTEQDKPLSAEMQAKYAQENTDDFWRFISNIYEKFKKIVNSQSNMQYISYRLMSEAFVIEHK